MRSILKRILPIFLFSLPLLLSGCKAVVLDPAGDIAIQQRDLLVQSTWLMLIIIIPVLALVVFFTWKYRATNKDADYEPDWDHSTHLELVIWAVPLLIIICLGALTWLGTHLLDPYRKLDRLAPGQEITQNIAPLEVDVVALDWKWLFIYPQYGIGAVNEMAAPVNRPIHFHITSSSVMNSFYIPALAGQIYAMAGMETPLHAVINKPGDYKGFSANYSGAGFSDMNFVFHGYNESDFDHWVADVKKTGTALDRAAYRILAKPSEKDPVQHYSKVESNLYHDILTLCVDPGPSCMSMQKMDGMKQLGAMKNTSEHKMDAMSDHHNMSDME